MQNGPEQGTSKPRNGLPNISVGSRVHGPVLQEIFRSNIVRDQLDTPWSVHSAISPESCARIQELIALVNPKHCLEVGCAMGISTLAILYALERQGYGDHIAVDPNQTATGPHRWSGIGVTMVKSAGLHNRFKLFEQPSHLVLPRLLAEKRRFDLIFIDGWHSFDFTFVDYFYADLLLNEGGVLVFDDWRMAPVHHVCWFLETHKDYSAITPSRLSHPMNPWDKLKRRISRNSQEKSWGSVRAYRKRSSTTVPSSFFASAFYPYFRLYRYWMKARGLQINSPLLPGTATLIPMDPWPELTEAGYAEPATSA